MPVEFCSNVTVMVAVMIVIPQGAVHQPRHKKGIVVHSVLHTTWTCRRTIDGQIETTVIDLRYHSRCIMAVHMIHVRINLNPLVGIVVINIIVHNDVRCAISVNVPVVLCMNHSAGEKTQTR